MLQILIKTLSIAKLAVGNVIVKVNALVVEQASKKIIN